MDFGKRTIVVDGEDVEIKLKTPGTKIGLETYGRHPGGAKNILKDDPTTFVYALVGAGEVAAMAFVRGISRIAGNHRGGEFSRRDQSSRSMV